MERHANYRGKDYRAIKQKDNTYILKSNSPQNGFEKYEKNNIITYIKNVNLNELEEVYDMRLLYKYLNKFYEVDKIENDKIKIGSGNEEPNFNHDDKYYFTKWVNYYENNTYVEITPIYPKKEQPYIVHQKKQTKKNKGIVDKALSIFNSRKGSVNLEETNIPSLSL